MLVPPLAEPLEPPGDAGVEAGSPGLGQARIGDLARHGVLEGELVLARDRRARPSADEVALLEATEADADVLEQLGDRPRPEDTTDDRGGLQRGLLGRREQIEASRDERLD